MRYHSPEVMSMPLVRLPERTIITSLYCPFCEGVGRLYRKLEAQRPQPPECRESLTYCYTLLCPQCGEIEFWGQVKGKGQTSATEASSS